MQNPVPDAPPVRSTRQDADPQGPVPIGSGSHVDVPSRSASVAVLAAPAVEIDGPSGPEPTRYGDWERKGRCIDF